MPTASEPHGGSDVSALAARIRGGDSTAEAELVERFGPGVAAALRRATRSRACADDLYQDAFHVAISKLRRGELREPAKLPGFLHRIARNLALRHFRRSRRSAGDAAALLESLDSAPGPLELVLAEERARLVRGALARLGSERDRALLYMLYIHEEERERLRERLALTPLHFNRVLFRARARCRERLAERLARSTGRPAET